MPYRGDPELSGWRLLLARLNAGAPAWVWVAVGIVLPIAIVATLFLSVPPTGEPTQTPPVNGTATPTSPASTPAPPPAPFVDAEAVRDGVGVSSGGEPAERLPAPSVAQIFPGNELTVDETGRAILRFADFLTVEVLRQGNLQVRVLELSEQSALAVLGQSGGAFVNDLLPPAERLAHRVEIHTEFARIAAGGTEWLVVKERNTPLEWVIALDAAGDDLTVEAEGIEKFAPSGTAYWIAPFGGPSIPIRYANLLPWLDTARTGRVEREIGDVLWPQADVITDTRSIGTFTETVASSGQNPPVVVLEDVILELHSEEEKPYELRDCNGDGIRDVYMEQGYIRFDFRGMAARVRAIDVQVLMQSGQSDPYLAVYNPADMQLLPEWDRWIDDQLISMRTDMRRQAGEPEQEPFHYAHLDLYATCFLGFSLTPPNPDDSPGPARWPVPLTPASRQGPAVSETATTTATATPQTATPTAPPFTGTVTAAVTPPVSVTPTPTPSVTATATATVTVTVTVTGTVTPKGGDFVGTQALTETPTPSVTGTVTGTVTPTGTTTATPTATPTVTPTPCVSRQPQGWVSYVVIPNENLTAIAEARGATPAQLAQVNCLASIDQIQVGQELWVPPLARPAPACAEEAQILLSVRKVAEEVVEIGWSSNCFLTGTAARVDGFATTPLTLIVGQNGSKQIGLGRACRVGETFVVFELWYAPGQKRTVTMQVEC